MMQAAFENVIKRIIFFMDTTFNLLNNSDLAKSEIVTWAQVRDLVNAANPSLAEIIDELKPSVKHTLIFASYPFGSNIFDKGELYIPMALP